MIVVRLPASIHPEELKIEIEAERITIDELLSLISKKIGKDLEKIFKRNGNLSPLVSIFINGKNVRYEKGLETEVKDGDAISIVPTVAGG